MKTEQLQIRLSPRQKAALKRRAQRAGQDLSSYVLSRVLPGAESRVGPLIQALRQEDQRRFALAELNDLLAAIGPAELGEALADVELFGLPLEVQNQVAAMVEHAAYQKGTAPPPWVAGVPPLEHPGFATPLKGLRLHLLRSSPVAFRRRNLFVDSTVGDRV